VESALTAGCGAAASQLQLRAGFAAGAPPEIKPNPLQQIVPPIIKGIKATVDGVSAGLSAASQGLKDGPATRGAIHYFADKFLLSGTFIEPNTIDIPKWAAILAETGYDNKDGWATLMTQLRANVSKLSPSEVEALIPALNSVGRYEKDLFLQMAEIVKARFTEFETPGLCKILPVYASHDHFDMALWDDVADGITYCNHYMAANNADLADIAATFAAYAKYEVDRGDLFVALARNIHEDRINALDNGQLKQVLGSLLGSFKALGFYPDCTQALLVAGRLKPHVFGPAENTLMAEVEAELRGHSPSGQLPWLDGGYKDWEHFHGAPFGDYQLWVMRDELIPQYYKPSDISPRPASMTVAPPTIGNGQEPAAAASS
jgi:protein phosphatase 1 regulatory subunit 42